jgi:hypothetical protein
VPDILVWAAITAVAVFIAFAVGFLLKSTGYIDDE